MKLEMFNVGFGDCFWLYNDENLLWIDCGSVAKPYDSFSMIEFAHRLMSDAEGRFEQKNALITHFHKDHISGFEHLANSNRQTTNINDQALFDKVYIPYLTIARNGRLVFMELVIFAYVFLSSHSSGHEAARAILTHPIWLTQICRINDIKCVSTGDQFAIGNDNFEVLWPDRIFPIDDTADCIVSEINRLTSGLEDYNSAKEALLLLIKNWFRKISIDNEEFDEEGLIDTVDNIRRSIDRLDRINGEWPEDFFLSNIEFGKFFARCVNSTSVVFHDTDQKVLMNGDITKRIIDNYLLSRYSPYYKAIKIQHHGTRNYFSDNLPCACNLLISTGPRRNYGKISSSYLSHPCEHANRWCTLGVIHCEIQDLCSACINSYCVILYRKTLDLGS